MTTAEAINKTKDRLLELYNVTRLELGMMESHALTEMVHACEDLQTRGEYSEKLAATIVGAETQDLLDGRVKGPALRDPTRL
jgi:hypothetical protein